MRVGALRRSARFCCAEACPNTETRDPDICNACSYGKRKNRLSNWNWYPCVSGRNAICDVLGCRWLIVKSRVVESRGIELNPTATCNLSLIQACIMWFAVGNNDAGVKGVKGI